MQLCFIFNHFKPLLVNNGHWRFHCWQAKLGDTLEFLQQANEPKYNGKSIYTCKYTCASVSTYVS